MQIIDQPDLRKNVSFEVFSPSEDDTEDRSGSVEVRLLETLEVQAALSRRPSPHKPEQEANNCLSIFGKHANPCPITYETVPLTSPSKWPQRPLLIRPSSGVSIRGVRYSSDQNFISLPGSDHCLGCSLPINTGREAAGKSLVVDFETDLFVGTVLFRIKGAKSLFGDDTHEGSSLHDSYFDSHQRTFAAIVQGRFLSPNVPMSKCVTGQVFRRPARNLPPRFILKSAVKVISKLAPQLQANFDGMRPCFFSPLVSTAQTVLAEGTPSGYSTECDSSNSDTEDKPCKYCLYAGAGASIESMLEEPDPQHPTSMHWSLKAALGIPIPKSKKGGKIKSRKKAFDRLSSQKAENPCFDTQTVYTFEFFQHMLMFDTLSVNLGGIAGRHDLSPVLDGQPLKFMAAHLSDDSRSSVSDLKWLWNFDIWHENLYDDAISAEARSTLDAVPKIIHS